MAIPAVIDFINQIWSVVFGMCVGIVLDRVVYDLHVHTAPINFPTNHSYVFALAFVQLGLNMGALGLLKWMDLNVLSLDTMAIGLYIPQTLLLRKLYEHNYVGSTINWSSTTSPPKQRVVPDDDDI